eukprot:GABV01009280.1.p1 GENE.GABV01009280.1~~GABV01009280.1.p1  ORF type:complete len:152 (+),score=38.29 GABV01009280.1:134-589(+)
MSQNAGRQKPRRNKKRCIALTKQSKSTDSMLEKGQPNWKKPTMIVLLAKPGQIAMAFGQRLLRHSLDVQVQQNLLLLDSRPMAAVADAKQPAAVWHEKNREKHQKRQIQIQSKAAKQPAIWLETLKDFSPQEKQTNTTQRPQPTPTATHTL